MIRRRSSSVITAERDHVRDIAERICSNMVCRGLRIPVPALGYTG